MLILGIDSSTNKLSVSLNDGKEIINNIDYTKNHEFMKVIIPLVERSLKKSGIGLSGVDIFAVNTGPGDFTGTRIGLSVAKTFALAESKPIFGIHCLHVMAAGIALHNSLVISKLLSRGSRAIILPVLDVRRSEVFLSSYSAYSEEGKNTVAEISVKGKSFFINKTSPEKLLEYAELPEYFNKDPEKDILGDSSVFTGGTAFLVYPDLKRMLFEASGRHVVLNKKNLYPSAGSLNICAYWKADVQRKQGSYSGSISGDQAIAPLYARDFMPFDKK